MPTVLNRSRFKKLVAPLATTQLTPAELQATVIDAYLQSMTITYEAIILAQATATVARSEEYVTLSRRYLATSEASIAVELTEMIQTELKALLLDDAMAEALAIWKKL